MPSLRRHPRQPTARLHHSRRIDPISSPPGSFGPPPRTPPSRMRGAESTRASSQPMHSKIHEDIALYSPICGHVAKRYTSVDIATHHAPRAVLEPPLGPRLPGVVTRRRAQPARRRRSPATLPFGPHEDRSHCQTNSVTDAPALSLTVIDTVTDTVIDSAGVTPTVADSPHPVWSRPSPRTSQWASASARNRPARAPGRTRLTRRSPGRPGAQRQRTDDQCDPPDLARSTAQAGLLRLAGLRGRRDGLPTGTSPSTGTTMPASSGSCCCATARP